MTLADYYYRKVPEYYDYMYLDGYTPDEIMYAARKKFNREYAERLARENEVDSIKITSEVKVR